MNLSSKNPVLVSFQKEWLCEMRSKQGVFLSGLFGFMAMAAVSFASAGQSLSPMLAAGLFALIVLFSSLISVPRIFLSEEDQGTFDLVRQWGNCSSVWLGKATFSAFHQFVNCLVLAQIYVVVINKQVENWWLIVFVPPLIGLAAANVLSLTSSLVIMANNRWLLATVISVPLLFPLLFLSIGSLRVAFGEGSLEGSLQSIAALLVYALVPFVIGPILADTLWRERKGP